MEPTNQPVHVAVPIAAIVVGALFILSAVIRPAFLWELGNMKLGRKWIGDTGLSIAFIVLGLALAAMGVVLLVRRGG